MFLGNQALRNKGLQVEREVGQQLVTAFFREEVDDAVECLVGTVGVQGSHTEMAGFGKRHRIFHSISVANLTNQNHIRGLAQGIFQCGKPVISIYTNFALGDDAVFVLVYEFNRVFDGDDVVLAVFVSVVDHRSQ